MIKFSELNELSKGLLGSYVKKASRSAATNAAQRVNSHLAAMHTKGAESEAFTDAAFDAHEKKVQRLKGIDKAVGKMTKEVDEAFKEVPTHSKNGTPNPNHPAFKTHKAAFDKKNADERAANKVARAPKENPVKIHHIDAAISNSYPDAEPYDHLARKFPDLHKQDGRNGSKLMDHLNACAKKHGSKDFHHHCQKAYDDFASDAAHDARNESTEKTPFSFSDWKASNVKTRKAKGYKDAQALGDSQKRIDAARMKSKGDHKIVEGKMHNDDDTPDTDIEKEQKAIYDAQTINFKKDAKANAAQKPLSAGLGEEKETMTKTSFKRFIEESVSVPINEAYHAAGTVNGKPFSVRYGDFPSLHHIAKHNEHLHHDEHKAILSHIEDHGDDDMTGTKSKVGAHSVHITHNGGHMSEGLDENAFNWKGTKSEINWKDDGEKASDSNVHKGTYGSEEHKAKGDGSVAPKKGRGRPAGSYQGEYKKRDPGSKAASAAKAMASKAEGLKVRGEYKQYMNDAIKKRQLALAGITK